MTYWRVVTESRERASGACLYGNFTYEAASSSEAAELAAEAYAGSPYEPRKAWVTKEEWMEPYAFETRRSYRAVRA